MEDGNRQKAEEQEFGKDVEVIAQTEKTGESRHYKSFGEFQRDFRFFWSSGQAMSRDDSDEQHFRKIIRALQELDTHGLKIETHRSGLAVLFILRKWES